MEVDGGRISRNLGDETLIRIYCLKKYLVSIRKGQVTCNDHCSHRDILKSKMYFSAAKGNVIKIQRVPKFKEKRFEMEFRSL